MNEVLLYNRPAENWNEALPLGNGSLGAMVFGNPFDETIALNEETLWSGYPMDKTVDGAYEAYRAAKAETLNGNFLKAQEILAEGFISINSDRYLSLGSMNISFGQRGGISGYKRFLDLTRAVQGVSFCCNGVHYKRTAFVSAPDRVFVMKLDADKKGCISFDLALDSQLRYSVKESEGRCVLNGICPTQSVEDSSQLIYSDKPEEKGIIFSAICSVKIRGGTKSCTDKGISVRNADEAVVYFTAVSSFNGFDRHPFLDGKEHLNEAFSVLGKAENTDYDVLLKRHIEDYRAFYIRSSFSLETGDKDDVPTDRRLYNPDDGLFALIYNFGKYLLISSSRAGSTATNLQGIWNNSLTPPWRSNYTVNINTQMNYWPALTCGMTELTEPLDDLINKIYINGQKTAKVHYNAPGFVCHHNTDIWGHTVPVSKGGGPVACTFSYWNMSGGWLCRHLFEKYEYTGDKNYLKDFAYPIMRAASRFYMSLLEEYEGGLVIPMSTSPENRFVKDGESQAVAKYTTMSQSIVYELFRNTASAAEILGCDVELKSELEDIIPRLALFKAGSKGQLLEWDSEYDEFEQNHRHVSHLYGLYPSNLISCGDKYADACKRSLEIRGDEGTGWALSWKLALWARLRDSQKALKLLKTQLRPVVSETVDYTSAGGTYPNMFDAHPPFQIDGNFGVVAGINEMLCQFEDDKVILLPAVPPEWKSGRFENLRYPHGICVSVNWKNGRIIQYKIKTKDKEICSETECSFGTEVNVC